MRALSCHGLLASSVSRAIGLEPWLSTVYHTRSHRAKQRMEAPGRGGRRRCVDFNLRPDVVVLISACRVSAASKSSFTSAANSPMRASLFSPTFTAVKTSTAPCEAEPWVTLPRTPAAKSFSMPSRHRRKDCSHSRQRCTRQDGRSRSHSGDHLCAAAWVGAS